MFTKGVKIGETHPDPLEQLLIARNGLFRLQSALCTAAGNTIGAWTQPTRGNGARAIVITKTKSQ